MAPDPPETAKAWLEREDSVCSPNRQARLEWVAAQMPRGHVQRFAGGWLAKYLFEESRYCFVYGQYIATVILGLAFLERTPAAEFYAAGRTDLERASIATLLREARDAGWLTDSEYEQVDEIRTLRNPLAHFRAPLSAGTIEHRSVVAGTPPWELLEKDARKVLVAVFHLLRQHTI